MRLFGAQERPYCPGTIISSQAWIVLQNSAGSIAEALIFLVASTLYGLLIVFK